MSGILNAFVGGSYGFKPINTVAPVVSGTTSFGSTLSTTNGTWNTAPPISSYTYQWYRSPSTAIGGATSSSYTLVQADVGNTLYCQVTAINPIGSTAANSNTTAAVTALAPSAPTIGTATSTGTTTASVTYTASASNGGSNITSYTAVSSPGGFTGSLATSGSGTINIAGLSPGTSYSFVVYATNGIGNSGYSGSSNTITTTAVVPNAPTIGTATATGTTTASVTYTASSYNGGSTITSYTAVSSPGGITGSIATSGSGTINISGLSVGTSYSFTVYATNGIGNSPSSGSSNTITTNRLAVSVVISSTTVDYVASTYQAPGYVAGVTDVTFTVNALVGSSSSGSYALYVDTSWNGGDTVTIVNNSYIEGAGGAGGRSSAAGSYPANLPLPGGAGGPAVYVGRPVTFYNYGYVGGGGGGGGGGESGATGVLGGGGGGGQGYYGGAAGAAFVYPPYTGSNGTAGTYTSAGSGGAGGYFAGDYGYTGGNGGGLGSAGATGGGGGGAGGAGGACLVGLGYVNSGSGIGGAAYGSQS